MRQLKKITVYKSLALSLILAMTGTVYAEPSSSFIESQVESVSVNQTGGLNTEIRDEIEREVDLAFRRTTTFLNVFIILLVFFPTSAAIAAWLLVGKLTRQSMISQQEIESIRFDAISQLKRILGEAQMILYELKQESQIAEQQTKILQTEMQLHQLEHQVHNNTESSEPITLAGQYSQQGDQLFFEGRYEEAINYYNQALQLHPNAADIWNNRGVILTRLQRYEPALASYEKSLQIIPDYADAWNNRGVTLLELQRYSEAIESYDHAIESRPDYADAWNNRGVALARLQRYEEAISSYNQAIRIKTDYLDAWNNRGHALLKLKKYNAALDCYEKASKLQPDNYRSWYNKGRCYAVLEQEDAAIESLQRALQLNPQQCWEFIQREPDFEKLRSQEKFIQFINMVFPSQRQSA